MKTSPIRFGILGAGRIAEGFAAAIKATDAQLIAIASRSIDQAQIFQTRHHILKAYGSYTDLLGDPDIDCVYIATPHSLHAEQMVQTLNAGKHILCEKAFTLNADQAKAIFALAKEKNCFVMEAMWTRFLPTIQAVGSEVQSGAIGEVRTMEATLGFQQAFDPHSRLFHPSLGGGALLDLGVYVITLANLVMGRPSDYDVTFKKYSNGVDEETSLVAHYPHGQANLCVSFAQSLTNDAVIKGTKGNIIIHHFHRTEQATIYNLDGTIRETIAIPHRVNGLEYEIIEVTRCLQSGLKESAMMPWSQTISIMEQLDYIRKKMKLVYPQENHVS